MQRAREADGNFRKHQLDSYEQHPLAEDPYDAPAESRRADQFEVLISQCRPHRPLDTRSACGQPLTSSADDELSLGRPLGDVDHVGIRFVFADLPRQPADPSATAERWAVVGVLFLATSRQL